MAHIVATCISENKGERKKPVASVELRENHGIVGDAHAGEWHRQVSLLASESIDKMRTLGLDVDSGDFAENLTTSGIDLVSLPVGSRLQIGNTVLEVTQIGKECHTRCAIYYQAGWRLRHAQGRYLCKSNHRWSYSSWRSNIIIWRQQT